MRVLLLSPGGPETQLARLPLAAQIAHELGAQLQVACNPSEAGYWALLPAVEKVLPFPFEAGATLADWANLLGSVREPDFQACLNFASGAALDLLISLSHIPLRVARGGFSCTNPVAATAGEQEFLAPLGVSGDPAAFKLQLPAKALEQAAAQQPSGQGPLLLLAPQGDAADWPEQQWQQLEEAVVSRISGGRTERLRPGKPLQQAAQIASADGVVSSSAVASTLGHYCGISVVELQKLSGNTPLPQLPLQQVSQALGLA